jgi:hypothetical protein
VIATVAASALKAGRRVECFETERHRRRRQTDDLTAEAEGRRRTKQAPKARHQLLTIAPGTAGVKRGVNRRVHVATEPGLSWRPHLHSAEIFLGSTALLRVQHSV